MYPLEPEPIAAAVGLALSVALSFAPGVRERWADLDGVAKRLILAVLCLTAGLAIMATNCQWAIGCMSVAWGDALRATVAAFISSQAAYTFLPKAENK